MQKTLALCVNWASGQCANQLGCDACTEAVSERSRNGFGTGSETGPLARPREGFARFELPGRRSTFAEREKREREREREREARGQGQFSKL